jgi:hypothetical protein
VSTFDPTRRRDPAAPGCGLTCFGEKQTGAGVSVEFSFMPLPSRGSEDAYETERIPPIVGRIALRG